MNIIVVRHAEKSQDERNPITESGRACALEAGAWLQTHGVRPVLVGFTDKLRTEQTAEAILTTYGLELSDLAQLSPQSMPVDSEGWARAVERIGERMRLLGLDGDVILGVHKPTQDFIVRTLGGEKPPAGNRGAAFIVSLENGRPETAKCVASWPGHPKGWQPAKLPG